MKQLTDSQLINLLSVVLGLTAALFGIMIRYFRNEVHKEVKFGNRMFNKYYEISFRNGTVEKHNSKYSKICRKLYDENQSLKLENQGLESLFVDVKNKANEFELKIAEIESKKLKERKKR